METEISNIKTLTKWQYLWVIEEIQNGFFIIIIIIIINIINIIIIIVLISLCYVRAKHLQTRIQNISVWWTFVISLKKILRYSLLMHFDLDTTQSESDW